ncbi:type VII toxin-antitoxin system MntA family adenylyltransferase antitoxin [Halomontanus rarus]|uniref:type VII toxin-antitoxin system MntA family adenylyltransferase antitoxin n=1 Tax=Halomontanus rarus TaxID=3034020 RepID=UPI0023E8B798|nr:nucleotidyltransferase domain-containing protein [Halovivax sp. TS33]
MDNRDDASETDLESTVRDVLQHHPVRLAILFGSRSRDSSTDRSDVDLAVEFDGIRPDDAEYSDVYLGLLDELENGLPVPVTVDLVDVHSMPPRFAREVFEHGTLLLGTVARRDELASERSGDPLSKEQAHARIDAAVERMRAGQSSN